MRYLKYVGDINIELEGEPEEIIHVLKYLDGADDKDGEIVLTIDGNEIGGAVIKDINKAQIRASKTPISV